MLDKISPLTFKKAKEVDIFFSGQRKKIWVAQDMDTVLDEFSAAQLTQEIPAHHCPFGGVLWPSGRAFADWSRNNLTVDEINSSETLELGCGVGFVACALAEIGLKNILATDAEQSFADYLFQNSKEWGVQGRIKFETLDWYNEVPLKYQKRFPLVIACDVLYEESHIQLLPKIAHECLNKDGTFYLADPERFRFDAAMAELKKLFNSVEDTVVETELNPMDIATGTVSKTQKKVRVHILKCREPI